MIDQEHAVVAGSEAIRRARAGLKDPKRPIASFRKEKALSGGRPSRGSRDRKEAKEP